MRELRLERESKEEAESGCADLLVNRLLLICPLCDPEGCFSALHGTE